MAKKLIKKLNDREIYAKFADYASADENGDKISDRKVKSVSVSGRTMTVHQTDGEQEVPVVPVPDAAGLILKSGEEGAYEWGAAGAAPGQGKLILNLGSTQGVDTGFNADSPRDVTFTIPEATLAADGLMAAADKAEFDRISGAAFDAKAEKADVSAAVNTITGDIEELDGRVDTLETNSATKGELSAAVSEINTTITGIQGDISDLESSVSDLESNKSDKVAGGTENDLAALDSTGNLKDSGIAMSDVGDAIQKAHTHANKATLDLVEEPYTTAEKTKLAGMNDFVESFIAPDYDPEKTVYYQGEICMYEDKCYRAKDIIMNRGSAIGDFDSSKWAQTNFADSRLQILNWYVNGEGAPSNEVTKKAIESGALVGLRYITPASPVNYQKKNAIYWLESYYTDNAGNVSAKFVNAATTLYAEPEYASYNNITYYVKTYSSSEEPHWTEESFYSPFYTSNDQYKLQGIAAGAQVNVIEKITANSAVLPISNKTVDIPLVSAQQDGLMPAAMLSTIATKGDLSDAVDTLNDTIDGIDGRVTTLDSDKADKDTDAVEDNLAKFDSTGNPVDAGKSIDDVLLKEEIDRVTFRTVIDDLLVEPGEPLVAEPDVTLINEIDGSETVARRAYEDEFGHNIAESIAGKQDKLTATPELARKCLGVHPDGSIGWIVGCNLDDGKTLVDGVIVQVPNNARSFLQTERSSITLNVDLDEGEIPNFVVEMTASQRVSVRVTSTIGEFSTTLKYSKDKGFFLEAGKTYQVTAAGTCWTFEEFITPSDAEYDFGGIQITYDQNGAHASVTDLSNIVNITEPVQVTDFSSDRRYNINAYSTCVIPFEIDTSLIPSGDFYEILDIIEDESAIDGYSAIISQKLTHLEANRPYLYISNDGTLRINMPSGEFLTLFPTVEPEIPLHASSGEWIIGGTYHYSYVRDIPGFDTEYTIYGFVGEASGSYREGDFAHMSGNAYFYPMRMYFKKLNA